MAKKRFSSTRVLCILYRTLLGAQNEQTPQESLPIVAYYYDSELTPVSTVALSLPRRIAFVA